MHGPKPSLTHITLPQLRQFGAAAKRACLVAIQLQAREALESVGVDAFSRVWIKASSSERFLEELLMGVPPVIVTFAGREDGREGEDVRVFGALAGLGRSEIRRPAADGGGLGGGVRVFLGGSRRLRLVCGCDCAPTRCGT